MGVMSRKVVPACSSLCYFCPSLRARSRQPVKRYKKLLTEIYQLSPDGEPNDRKISKLCEYASRNASRIPNITSYLDQRFYKDLRNEQLALAKVVPTIYRKLFYSCKDQMPLLAASSLSIMEVLLCQRNEDLQILGCLMLVDFLSNQVDASFMSSVEGMIPRLCQLGQEMKEDAQGHNIRSAALQAFASLVIYMGELSHISMNFDDIVLVMMDNYEATQMESEYGIRKQWSGSASAIVDRDHSISLRETPSVALGSTLGVHRNPVYWSRVCLHNMAKIAKEATTVRRVVDPLFRIFDERNYWSSDSGIAYSVLHEMLVLMEKSGQNSHLLLSIAIKHIDHKNVVKNTTEQIDIVKVVSRLARNARVQVSVAIMTALCDTARHLRSCMRSVIEASDEQEDEIKNIAALYCTLEECLVNLSEKVGDVGPIHDMLGVVLENLSPNAVVARTLISSVYRIAQVAASTPRLLYTKKDFPEALFHELLVAMMHTDNNTRVGAHRVLSAILAPLVQCPWSGVGLPIPLRGDDPHQIRLLATSAFSSCTATKDELRKSSMFGELLKRNSEISGDQYDNSKLLQLTDQQIEFLLSSIWTQASLKDNTPTNFEAMAHSFNLALSQRKDDGDTVPVRCFQLALSLRSMSLDSQNSLQPSCRRSLYSLGSSMLLFSARAASIPEIVSLVKETIFASMADPHLCLVEDSRLCATNPETSGNQIVYGSREDEIAAADFLSSVEGNDEQLKMAVASALECRLGASANEKEQFLKEFSPDESFLLATTRLLESQPRSPGALLDHADDEDPRDEFPLPLEEFEHVSVETGSQSDRRTSVSGNCTDVPSVNQLMQSLMQVVEAAGEEPPASSSAPVPYDQMKSQCEALVAGKQQKMSAIVSFVQPLDDSDDLTESSFFTGDVLSSATSSWNTEAESSATMPKERRMQRSDSASSESERSLRLPPASPYDKFLKAAGC